MERKDYYKMGILMLVPILIFYPVLNSIYFYSDEGLQLWLYRKGSPFAMFVPQGRLLQDWLCRFMYSHIETIAQLGRLRLFALVSWVVCVPVWYTILWRLCRNEGLPSQLPFISVLFLVCSLPFGVSIQWAACMELAIANTCGLVSGYFVYRYNRRGWLPALAAGLVSLCFYQNGFGCYILPFFLYVIAREKADRKILSAVLVYFAIYGVYYVFITATLKLFYHTGVSERTALATDPLAKAYFLFSKALPQSFYFNFVVAHTSMAARFVFGLLLAGCLWLNYRLRTVRNYWFYVSLLFAGFVLIYLPSLILKENYASNRTLLGLDMAVFFWVMVTLIRSISSERALGTLLTFEGGVLVLLALYNYRVVFLPPAVDEYNELKTFVSEHFRPEVSSVDFIRSPEDLVRKKYGLRTSWDEYGVSSTYFNWMPDAVTRQLVFEKTGDRGLAERLTIRVWVSRDAYSAAGQQGGPNNLLIDAPAILRK